MADPKKEIREKDPNYRKKAQWFGLACIILLCVTLILSVFLGGGRRRTAEKQPLPIDQADSLHAGSQKDLQARIQQERIRRQKQLEEGRGVDNDARMQELLERRQEQQTEKIPDARPTIYEEFREQEKRRALMARRSRFGLRPQHAMAAAPAMQMGSADGLNLSRTNLQKERQQIEQAIAQLQQGQSPDLSGLFATGSGQGRGVEEGSLPEQPVIAGQVASEAVPEPGQRLIPTGTMISGVLDQQLMSDYTGPFRGMVTHDVYDVSGNYILIPKGSRITGRCLRISNVNEPIQARMGLAVKWLVLPDGKRISFERRVAALDQAGVPAIKDKVNYHFLAQFLGVAAYAVLSSETSREGSGYNNDQTFEGQMSQSMREQFAPLAAKYLNLVPTITLRIGTPIKIFLEDKVYAHPWASLGQKLYQAS